jgi:DNA-binding CsgD family transcriptional regulator
MLVKVTARKSISCLRKIRRGPGKVAVYLERIITMLRVTKPNNPSKQNIMMIETTNQENVVLTQREKEILNLWSTGMSAKNIAGQLYISTETVRKHLQNSYRKLNVSNKIQAVNKLFAAAVA